MSDAPAESYPLSGCASTTATVRAALLDLYNAIKRTPNEVALWAALSDALRYVFEKLDSGEVSHHNARYLDELFIVTNERHALYLAGASNDKR